MKDKKDKQQISKSKKTTAVVPRKKNYDDLTAYYLTFIETRIPTIRSLQPREAKAFNRFYHSLGAILKSLFYKRGLLTFENVAFYHNFEDYLQDTFITLVEKPESFDPEKATVVAFAYKIILNKHLDTVRHTKIQQSFTERALLFVEELLEANGEESPFAVEFLARQS